MFVDRCHGNTIVFWGQYHVCGQVPWQYYSILDYTMFLDMYNRNAIVFGGQYHDFGHYYGKTTVF